MLATSSRDRPMPSLRRVDLAALATARNALLDEASRSTAAARIAPIDHDGDHHQVAEALADAAALADADAPAWHRHLWAAETSHAIGRRRECDRDLADAFAAHPHAAAETHRFARLERRRNRIADACRHAAAYAERHPDSPHGLVERGHLAAASGDREDARRHFVQALRHARDDLRLLREIDEACPGLATSSHDLGPVRLDPLDGRCAVLIPGHLRRLDATAGLLLELARHCDLFICTNEEHRGDAAQLAASTGAEVRIVEDHATDRAAEEASEIPSMKQWLKLRICLDMVRDRERRDQVRYAQLLKLRTDHVHLNVEGLLDFESPTRCTSLVASSDKVFAGPRETMMPLGRLFDLMRTLFIDREGSYWPIDVEQVLRSSDTFKWYGMKIPERIVGPCLTARVLRARLATNRHAFATYVPRRRDRFVSIFTGHRRMASETCFARHLNLLGTTVADHSALRGILLSDRLS